MSILFSNTKEEVLEFVKDMSWQAFLRLVQEDEILIARFKGAPYIVDCSVDIDSFFYGLKRLIVVCYEEKGKIYFDLFVQDNDDQQRGKQKVSIADVVRWTEKCEANILKAVEVIFEHLSK